MVRRLIPLLAAALLPAALHGQRAVTAADLAAEIVGAGLNPEECYRVRDLSLVKEDVRIFFTDGYLVLGKPVNGRPLSAVFSADVEGGDAEVLLFPPLRSERMSLANYTGSPNLNEHFKSAVILFTDDAHARLLEQIRERQAKRTPEMGAMLAQAWDPVVRNFSESIQIRLVNDRLSATPPADGLFYAALGGAKLGNFDVIYDPRWREQITVGQVAFRDNGTFFNLWTRFTARSFRKQPRDAGKPDVTLRNFRIDATLEPDLRLRVVTKATVIPTEKSRRALLFDLSRMMRVSEAFIDGEPAGVFQPDSLRANLIRGGANDVFLVSPARELEPGRPYEIEFRHEGDVVSDAGNRVYYVGARGSWYPNRGLQFASYDLTFRHPKDLRLVATGQPVEEKIDGLWRITRRRTETPIRLAGFNLGDYETRTAARGGLNVELYANRRVETALERPPQMIVVPPLLPPNEPRRPGQWATVPRAVEPPSPSARLDEMASEIARCFEFMTSHFGPPPLKTLTVAPIPGTFGQGFPGLVYLSTLSYLDPSQRPGAARSTEYQQTFFTDILQAHETAHQWWGNVVSPAGYEDEWLMEALADYSSLLYLERRRGPRALESVLEVYKRRLLGVLDSGKTVESMGPVVWGARLISSQAPGAWRIIVYEKGSWIMHMLRRRLGDQRFLAMLAELRRQYEYRGVTTEDFRRLAARHLPPKSPDPALETFFDQWVYGTGIPDLKLEYKSRGKAPTVRISGSVLQSEVDNGFSVLAPLEIHFKNAKPVTRWVSTGEGSFTVTVPATPARVLLDPSHSILRR